MSGQDHTRSIRSGTSDHDQHRLNHQQTPVSSISVISSQQGPALRKKACDTSQAHLKKKRVSKPSMFAWTHTQPSSPSAGAPTLMLLHSSTSGSPTPASPPTAAAAAAAAAPPTPPPATPQPSSPLVAVSQASARPSSSVIQATTLPLASPGRTNSLLITPPPRNLSAMPTRTVSDPTNSPSSPDSTSPGPPPSTTHQAATSIPTSPSTLSPPLNAADLQHTVQRPSSANLSLKAAFENNRKALFSTAVRSQEFYPASSIGFTTPSQLPPCKEWDAREARSAAARGLRQQQWLQQQQLSTSPTQYAYATLPQQESPSSPTLGLHNSISNTQAQQTTTRQFLFGTGARTSTSATPASAMQASAVSTPLFPSSQELSSSVGSPPSPVESASTNAATRHAPEVKRPWSVPSLSQPHQRAKPTSRRRQDSLSSVSVSSMSVDETPVQSSSSSSSSSHISAEEKDANSSVISEEISTSDATAKATKSKRGTRNRGSVDVDIPPSETLDSESSSNSSSSIGDLQLQHTGDSSDTTESASMLSEIDITVDTIPSLDSSRSSSSTSASIIDIAPSSSELVSMYRRNGARVERPVQIHTTRIHQPCEWDRNQPRPPPPAEESWRRVLVGEYQSTATDHFAEDAGFVRKMLSSRGRVLVIGKSSRHGLWHAIRVVRMARLMLLQTESHVPVFQPVVLQTEGDRSVQGLPPGCLILYTQKILAGSFPATGPPMWVSQESDPQAVARAIHTRMAKQQQPVVLECFGPAAGSVAVHAMAAARLLAQSRGRDLCVVVDAGEEVEVADNAYGTALLTRFIIIACAPNQPTYLRNRPSLKFLARRS